MPGSDTSGCGCLRAVSGRGISIGAPLSATGLFFASLKAADRCGISLCGSAGFGGKLACLSRLSRIASGRDGVAIRAGSRSAAVHDASRAETGGNANVFSAD